ALDAGLRAAHRRGRAVRGEAQDAAVQRLRRSGCVVIRGHGLAQKLLNMLDRNQRIRWIGKPLVFLAALAPFAWLLWRGFTNDLGTNPIETLNRYTGDWVLRFLLITLAVTPLRRLTGWNVLLRFRRMLGLFAFFYVSMHFLSWIWIDQHFDVDAIVKDVIKRPFITLGFACLVSLIPLAVTSTNAMVRRLGARNWQRLHRIVYGTAVGGVI